MSLIYKFKKEELEDGHFVERPRILVRIKGVSALEMPALVDTGCDTTVIPKSIAEAIGINLKGGKSKLYDYSSSTEVIRSTMQITFMGKNNRENISFKIPILVAMTEKEEVDIPLGITGVFDYFDIIFKKSKGKIYFKKVVDRIYV